MQYRYLDRLIVSLGTAALSFAVLEAAVAGAPSQQPLLAPVPVAPNVVFTLDDSGSMLGAIMPEDFTSSYAYINSSNKWTLGTGIMVLTPQEQQDTPGSVTSGYGYFNALIPTRGSSADSSNALVLDDAKRRSSRFNTIYYNPEVRYEPWLQADGTRMPYPTPIGTQWKVPLDPIATLVTNTTVKVDLTATGANAFSVGGRNGSDQAVAITTANVDWCAIPVVVSNGTATTNNATRPGAAGNDCASITPGTNSTTQTNDRNALVNGFDPAVFYEFNSSGTSAKRISLNEAASNATFIRLAGRTDCTVSGEGTVCTKAQEFRNFATWFMYHRTRLLLAKAAVAEAFAGDTLKDFRLGYGALNNPTASGATSTASVDGVNNNTIQTGVRDFPVAKTAFYNWLFTKRAYGGTALRRAIGDVGTYYQRQDNQSPWANDPSKTTQTVDSFAACRKSFHILTTDGYWTDQDAYAASNSAARTNVDGTTSSDILTDATGKKTYQYKPGDAENSRFKDSASDMLADVAMYYWNHDLAPKIPNAVPIVPADSKNNIIGNPAFWQHMVNYTVGLGVASSVNPWNNNVVPTWPTTRTDADKAVDLVHAAYNSRGLFFSASDSKTFAARLKDVLGDISNQSYSTGGVGVAGSSLSNGLSLYAPTYNSGGWTGDLRKFSLDQNTGKIIDADTSTADSLDPTWSANSRMPAPNNRNIYAWNGSSAVEFKGTPSSIMSQMGTAPAVNADMIEYLRGNSSKEGAATGTYRTRNSKLGDIINSAPFYVKDSVNLFYQNFPVLGKDYQTFLNTLKLRPALVFAGANDGMLHAFQDNVAPTSDGKEVFAFIPQAVLPKLTQLSVQGYVHQFYVDGPVTETHAVINGKWASLLLGSMGGGGKGVYAIDITDTSILSGSTAGKAVLWEINDKTSDAVGHIFNEIEVGPVKIGDAYKWVALIGNGSNSASGEAQLLVMDLDTKEITALKTGVGTPADSNGLGGVRSARDSNGIIQAAYAGDEKGNLWRFNLTGATKAAWGGKAAFNQTALLTAKDSSGNVQPITAPPSVFVHPWGGSMVVVATGKLTENSDLVAPALGQIQTVYGVWDKQPRRLAPTGSITKLDRAGLIEQKINTSSVASGTAGTYYTVTSKALNWKTDNGWLMDMTLATGQRSIYPSTVVGSYVLINTVVPSVAGCGEATSFKALLDPLNGNVGTTVLFDTDDNGIVNSSDKSAVWYAKPPVDGRNSGTGRDVVRGASTKKVTTPTVPGPGPTSGYACSYVATDNATFCQSMPGARTWRVIANPPYKAP